LPSKNPEFLWGELMAVFRLIAMLLASASLTACAATPQEVRQELGQQYIGKSADDLVLAFGPPASTFKMNSGEIAYAWQLSAVTDMHIYERSGTAETSFCKVNVVANAQGIVTRLSTEDSARGVLGLGGSVCSRRLGMQRKMS
jgi:hypothetical protein